MTDTRLDLIFGGPAFRVEREPREGESDVTLITGDRLASIKMHRGRDSALSQQQAATCSFTVAGGLTIAGSDPLELGDGFTLALTPAAQVAAFGAEIPGAIRFVGRVTDFDGAAISIASMATAPIPVTAASLLARFDNTPLDLSWPNSTTDITILVDVLTELWTEDAGLRVGPWRLALSSWINRVADRDPVPPGYRFDAWALAGESASSVIALVGGSTSGVLVERLDGALDYIRPTEHTGIGEGGFDLHVPIEIPTTAILSPVFAGKRIGDVINVATISYGDGTPTVTVSDAHSVELRGKLTGRVDTRLGVGEGELGAIAAEQLGAFIVGRFGAPAWRLPSFTVDVLALIEAGDLAMAQTVIGLELESSIRITGALPDTAPEVVTDYIVISQDEQIDSSAWRVTFGLVDRWLIDTVQWRDYPGTLTWDDVPDTIDWVASARWVP